MTSRARLGILIALLLAVSGVAIYLYLGSQWFSLDEEVEPSTCPVCGETHPFSARKGRPHTECPTCGSWERHRLLVHYLQAHPELLAPGQRVLHFAPNRGVGAFMRRQPGLVYKTADLFVPADLKLDLAKMDQPDESWDLIIVYHVLEHVPDDAAAMRELYRVLAPGGHVILQVPLHVGQDETYEDPTITDPAEREKHFGQSDHVRVYGVADFRRRLEAAGFAVEAVDHLASLSPDVIRKHRLQRERVDKDAWDERIWIATRPARSRAR